MSDSMPIHDHDPAAATHSTFQVSRRYPQSPRRVFEAFRDPGMVRRWRVEDENCAVHEFAYDFRIGGTEISRFTFAGGPEIRLDAQFQDIVPDQRIVFTYRMAIGTTLLSVSVTTIELRRNGKGTELLLTEQGVYFGDADMASGREEGNRQLLEKLARAIAD